MSKYLDRPGNGPLLGEYLQFAEMGLKNTPFKGPLYYVMDFGYVGKHGTVMHGKGANKTGLHRPSYNMVLYYKDYPFFVAHYEMDKSLSLEISEEEAESIEDYLAEDVLAILSVNGIGYYVGHRLAGALMSLLRKESDDKKFLPSNS